MSTFPLSVALTINPRTQPVLDRRVGIDGVDMTTTGLFPSELFYRQLKFAEFDVSEMSLASLMIATAHGSAPWVAIPVFTTRVFFHIDVIVRTASGISAPDDLRGRRMGVPEYQQTRAVWTRGALEHEFGVEPSAMHWFMERSPDRSHGGATSFAPPPGVRLDYVPPEKDLGTMLLAGEIDAAVTHISTPTVVDRALVDLTGRSEVRPLFPDAVAEARRYFRKSGIYPINHCIVLRRSIAERRPELPEQLFHAFEAARTIEPLAISNDPSGPKAPAYAPTVSYDPVADGEADADAYGMANARSVLDTLATYVFEQGLTQRRVDLSEIFAHSFMG